MILRAVLFFSSCRISTKKGHFTERHAAGCIWQMLLAIRRLTFFFVIFYGRVGMPGWRVLKGFLLELFF